MNCNFTIIIPYHAAEQTIDFLKRQLTYYFFSPVPVLIILAVSGNKEVKIELKKFCEQLNCSRFSFFEVDEEDVKNGKAFFEKIILALNFVTTPYVTLCGADDLIILETGVECTEVLNNKPDVVAVVGSIVAISHNGSFSIFDQLAILDECPILRIKHVLSIPNQTFYSMRRKEELIDEFKKSLSYILDAREISKSYCNLELAMAMDLVVSGKIHKLGDFFMLKSVHPNNSGSYEPSFEDRITSGSIHKFSNEYFKIVKKQLPRINYVSYKFLFLRYQIQNMRSTIKQILYNFLYKKWGFSASVHLLIYVVLKYLFHLHRPSTTVIENGSDFFNSTHYDAFKKYYLVGT